MKTAAEHYDDALARMDRRISVRHLPSERSAIIREECVAAIEAAVAQEHTRCVARLADEISEGAENIFQALRELELRRKGDQG